jgi:hypothetical protein
LRSRPTHHLHRTCLHPCLPAAAGASFEVTDPDKGNPAQIAAYWGHLEAVVKLVEAGCSWPHGKTARGVAGGDVVKWICNITTNKVRADGVGKWHGCLPAVSLA